jgi:putative endopeptidase
MDVYVGSMATLMDVDDIELEGVDSPWEALYQLRKARTNYIVGKLLDPDSSALWISPIEVDAYYSNDDNAIFVGCGYLGGEIFDVGFSIEDQLAVVGHTVGHEVGHAFDGMGVLYDSKGNDRSWMGEKDKAAFDGRRKRVQDYLETIRPLGVEEYDGQQVSDEMIADMAGLKAVLRIAKGIDGFDYKRFFTSYCIGWKSVTTLRDLEDILAEDTHPLDATRANVSVMQTDEFVETYGVEPGDGMYLAPEDRICVW